MNSSIDIIVSSPEGGDDPTPTPTPDPTPDPTPTPTPTPDPSPTPTPSDPVNPTPSGSETEPTVNPVTPTSSDSSQTTSGTNNATARTTQSTSTITYTDPETVPVPNTGISGGDPISVAAVGGSVVLGLFIIIFALKHLKSSHQKRTFGENSTFHLPFRPAHLLSGAALLLAFAFLANSLFTTFHQEDPANAASSLSLSVQNIVPVSVTASKNGTVGYGSQDVVITSATSNGYTLYIETPSSKLYPNGNQKAGYLAPASGTLDPDSWGYNTNNGTTWLAVPETATAIKSQTTATSASDTTRVYFAANATTSLAPGTYRGTIRYTALANASPDPVDPCDLDPTASGCDIQPIDPCVSDSDSCSDDPDETRTLSDISSLQDMSYAICDNTTIGTSKSLTDTRDSSSYTVAKLLDGRCWMTQNLRIVGKTITDENSNISDDTYEIPKSSTGWGASKSDADEANVYYGSNTTYGAHYSWAAVTAGTEDGFESICPLGWRLPSTSEFHALNGAVNGDPNATDTSTYFNNMTSKTTAGYPHFALAGLYRNGTGGAYGQGDAAAYWANSGAHLWLVKEYNNVLTGRLDVPENNLYNDAMGKSVRCIAQTEDD